MLINWIEVCHSRFEEFAQQQATINSWYLSLVDDLFYRPIVFIGTVLEDSPFHHYVALRGQRDRGVKEVRPKSYFVSPHIGPLRADALKEENIVSVECTGREFFDALHARLAGTDMSLPAVRKGAFPHLYVSSATVGKDAVIRYFDPVVPASLPPTPRRLPNNFYLGTEPTWQDIDEGRDGHLETTDALLDDLDHHSVRSSASYYLVQQVVAKAQ